MSLNEIPQIPTSNALAECDPLSLHDLFARNPEQLADQHIEQIVFHMRELRSRLESTGAVKHTKAKLEGDKVRKRRNALDVDFSDDDLL